MGEKIKAIDIPEDSEIRVEYMKMSNEEIVRELLTHDCNEVIVFEKTLHKPDYVIHDNKLWKRIG